MPIDTIVKTLLGLSPVLMLLAVLVYLDSWKLVDLFRVLQMLVIGGLLARAARVINAAAMNLTHLDLPTFGRYVAPCIEESLKAGVLVYLFLRNRIGFMVDAAIIGFTIGAGFGVVENLYYLQGFTQASVSVSACAVKRRRFPVGENPTRQLLQPEATGTVEVTK